MAVEVETVLEAQWSRLAAQLDALTLRERVLVNVAVLSVLLGAWNLTVWDPMSRSQKQMQEQLAQAQGRQQPLSAAAAALSARAGADPDREVRERILRLQARMESLGARRDTLGQTFIAPEAMAGLLRKILSRHHLLHLLSLRTEPPQPANEADQRYGKAQARDDALAIYRHEMTVEIEGGYFDLLEYLRALEQQALFWDSLDYEVQAYPLARIRLKVYTLSFRKELLGA